MKNKKRNIAYAAIIASKARIKLNNSLQSVLDDGGRIYYTDTDSIFAGYKNNKKKEKIGDIE
jgi:DNA polymerase elongation subunit (family B)